MNLKIKWIFYIVRKHLSILQNKRLDFLVFSILLYKTVKLACGWFYMLHLLLHCLKHPPSRKLSYLLLLQHAHLIFRRWLGMLITMLLWRLMSQVYLTEALGRIWIVFEFVRPFIPFIFICWFLISFYPWQFPFLLSGFAFQLTDFT